jgi:hypothetical protein
MLSHICDGEEILDEEGMALANHDAAPAHATTVAGELLRDAGLKGWKRRVWWLRVLSH